MGDAGTVFSTVEHADTYGEILRLDLTRPADLTEIENRTGGNLAAILTKGRFELEIETVFPASATPPALGDQIALPLAGLSGNITGDIKIMWANKDARKLSFRVARWDGMGNTTATERGYPARAASALLNPAGAENDILLTAATPGAAGNDLTAAIAIDSTTAPTQLTAARVGDAITVTSGDKRRMIVTGELTDGTDPLVVPPLFFSGVLNDRPRYSTEDTVNGFDLSWEFDAWYLSGVGEFVETSWQVDSGSLYPPESGWTVGGPKATGTPTVTAAAATAEQTIAAINAANLGVTAENAPGSDGTGTIATVAQTNFTNGRNRLD
jgi:hypothetical protein